MKKTLFKDTFREIRNSLGRFLSIFMIVALGVSFFAGIKSTAPDMKNTADKYFDEYRLMDFHLLSTMGFDEKDIKAIEKVENIEGIAPSYSINALIDLEDDSKIVKLLSIPIDKVASDDSSYINRVKLVKGRYPENSKEILVENSKLPKDVLSIGSKIKLSSGTDEDILESLKNEEFTIVGIVESPSYISFERGSTNIGNGSIDIFAMIPEESFNLPVYTDVYLTVKEARGALTYDKEYDEILNPIKKNLKGVAKSRENLRFEEIIDQANEELDKGSKELADIEKPEWYVLKRSETRDYIDFEMAADRIDAIAKVFPVFFFLIAILVSLTTMTRMVDEERGYIGSLKALGYSNISIASKYLIYAGIASASGSIVGLLLGFKVFPTVIFNAYRIMYIMPEVTTGFNFTYAILSTTIAVLTTTMAALVACYGELVETPALLLRPKAPKPGKRILLERIDFIWSRLKFTQKVTARNLFRYKRRFFMTVIGISGCTALLVAGFGLKDSITAIPINQYDEIYKYEMVVDLKNGKSKDEELKVLGLLKDNNDIEDYMIMEEQTIDIGNETMEETINLIVPEKMEKLKDFITLKDRVTGKELDMKEDGVILTEKIAKLLGVEIGHEIYIKDENDKKTNVKVIGITENYLNHYIYMPSNIYEEVFNEEGEFQRILARTRRTDEKFEDEISKELLKYDDVNSIEFITGISKTFNDAIGSLNYVIMVLILSAAALAFVVLYNLTNINISERIREIATIKVLGFYDKEVSAYVYKENTILTLIGTGVGLFLGVFLHKFIIDTTEIEFMMFGQKIKAISYLYSAILTMVFAVLVNFVMHFKLKKVDMVESLKSVD